MRNEKWEMTSLTKINNQHQYNLFLIFLNFLFVNNIIMSWQGNNINWLKHLPFYETTIKLRIKKFTNAKLLSELPFFEKPIKAKIKQLSIKKPLSEQPFYKQPIKNHALKN